jgi:cytochrome c-type biogenesis protein CcmH/NrfG
MAQPKQPKSLGEILAFSQAHRDELLRAALECYDARDFARGETILLSLTALDAHDQRALKLLASTLLQQGKHQDAERRYQEAYELDPKDPYTLIALAELKLKVLKIAEAVPLFNALFAMDPEGKHPAANRGREALRAYYELLAKAREQKQK